jgi:methyl-accepting chemotaxis protein
LGKAYLSGNFEEMLEKVYEVGAAERMAGIQAEGLGVKLKNLADRFKLLALAIGDAGLLGIMKGFVDTLKVTAETLKDFVLTDIGAAITKFALFTLTLGALTKTIQILTSTKLLTFLVWAISRFGAWLPLIVAVGTALHSLYTSASRTADELARQALEIETLIDTMNLYSEILVSTKDKINESKEAKLQYLSTLHRLVQAVPELKDEIEFTTEAFDDNIKAIERHLNKKLELQIEANKKAIIAYREELESITKWHGLWIRLSEDTITQWKKLGKAIQNATIDERAYQRDVVGGWYKVGEITGITTAWRFWGKVFRPIVKNYVADVKKAGKETQDYKETVEKLTQTMINSGLSFHQLGFTTKQIVAELEKLGATKEMIEKVLKAISDKFPKATEKLEDTRDAAKQLSDTMMRLNAQFASMMSSMEVDAFKKIDRAYDLRMEKIKKHYKDRLVSLKKLLKDEKEAERQAQEERDKLEAMANMERERKRSDLSFKISKIRLETELAHEKKKIELRKQLAIDDAETLKGLNRELIRLDREAALKRVQLLKDDLKAKEKHYNLEGPVIAAARKAIEDAELKVAEAGTKDRLALKKEELKEEKRMLREQLETMERRGQEYVDALSRAYALNLINLNEYMDGIIAATGSLVDNLEHGFKRAWEAVDTWWELMQKIGKEFPDKFAGELTASLWDFIDGTKSAEEAFQDFTRNMLRWIGEIVVKLSILKAIQAAMGMGGGPTGITAIGGLMGIGGRGGGIVGKDPFPVRVINPNALASAQRFQEGGMVRGVGEVPAILHQGEGVFTPEQMDALGGQKIELTTINVQDFKMLDRVLSTAQGKGAMINFIGSNAPMIKRIIG